MINQGRSWVTQQLSVDFVSIFTGRHFEFKCELKKPMACWLSGSEALKQTVDVKFMHELLKLVTDSGPAMARIHHAINLARQNKIHVIGVASSTGQLPISLGEQPNRKETIANFIYQSFREPTISISISREDLRAQLLVEGLSSIYEDHLRTERIQNLEHLKNTHRKVLTNLIVNRDDWFDLQRADDETNKFMEFVNWLIPTDRNPASEDGWATTILGLVDLAVVVADSRGTIELANQHAGTILGTLPESLIGCHYKELIDPVSSSTLIRMTSKYRATGKVGPTEVLLRRQDGTPVSVRARLLSLNYNATERHVVFFDDISHNHRDLGSLKWQAAHDPVTGLLNRDGLIAQLEEFTDSEDLMVVYLNLDDFKQVNHAYGHQTGDVLLARVADRIVKAVSHHDLVARIGSDDFVVIGHIDRNLRTLTRIAQRVLDNVTSQPINLGEHDITVTASVGATWSSYHGDLTFLLAKSEQAMNIAKLSNSRIKVFAENLDHPEYELGPLSEENWSTILRNNDSSKLLPVLVRWSNLANEVVGHELEVVFEGTGGYSQVKPIAAKRHLEQLYNRLLLKHLAMVGPVKGFVEIAPIRPDRDFLRGLLKIADAAALDRNGIRIVLDGSDLTGSTQLKNAQQFITNLRATGFQVALRWKQGSVGEIFQIAQLEPDQIQAELTNSRRSLRILDALCAFSAQLGVELGLIQATERHLRHLQDHFCTSNDCHIIFRNNAVQIPHRTQSRKDFNSRTSPSTN